LNEHPARAGIFLSKILRSKIGGREATRRVGRDALVVPTHFKQRGVKILPNVPPPTLFSPEGLPVAGRDGLHPAKAGRRSGAVDCRKTADGFAALSAGSRWSNR
jgi:hypothetical protein